MYIKRSQNPSQLLFLFPKNTFLSPTDYSVSNPDTHHRPALISVSHWETSINDMPHGTCSIRNP